MKKIKSTAVVLTLLVLTVLTGCSDSLITPQKIETSGNTPESTFDSKSKLSSYSTKIKLRTGESFTISKQETTLQSFRIVEVSECNPKEIRISSTTIDSDLGCYWQGYSEFGLDDVTIENKGEFNKIIDVRLQGKSLKK